MRLLLEKLSALIQKARAAPLLQKAPLIEAAAQANYELLLDMAIRIERLERGTAANPEKTL